MRDLNGVSHACLHDTHIGTELRTCHEPGCTCMCHPVKATLPEPLPAAAVEAIAIHLALLRGQRDEPTSADRRVAVILLAAALPHLTAAAEPGLVLKGDEVHRALDAARAEGAAYEREDCALLAEDHGAAFQVIADLIRARDAS